MLSDVVAEQVSRLRRAAGMNRDQLADRCQLLGLELTAAALTNVETGRRDKNGRRRREVTVDELVILAAALNVPPLQLVYPLGSTGTVEMLPGMSTETWTAYRWAFGDLTARTETEALDHLMGRADVVDAYQRHETALTNYLAQAAVEHPNEDDQKRADDAMRELAAVREEMTRRGWALPLVPIDMNQEVAQAQRRRRQRLYEDVGKDDQ